MQCAGIDAQVKEADERNVKQCRPRIAQSAETPRRRPERRIQQNDTAQPPEPAGKLDVFHQRMSAKPPNLSKTDALHEDGLITKQRSSERIDASK